MQESEWIAAADPAPMLEYLRGKASDRKRLLFAAASFRHLMRLLPDRRQHRGVELLEEMAEGTAPMATRRGLISAVRHAFPPDQFVAGAVPADHSYYVALMLYRALVSTSPAEHAWQAAAGRVDAAAERRAQSSLLRDLIGNPFRPPPPLPPAVLAWNDRTVLRLAEVAYDDRRIPDGTLDPSRLAILADALLDAGCDDEELLAHLRSPGPHVRGCFAVDIILGKS